jgi:hypothetical protein
MLTQPRPLNQNPKSNPWMVPRSLLHPTGTELAPEVRLGCWADPLKVSPQCLGTSSSVQSFFPGGQQCWPHRGSGWQGV